MSLSISCTEAVVARCSTELMLLATISLSFSGGRPRLVTTSRRTNSRISPSTSVSAGWSSSTMLRSLRAFATLTHMQAEGLVIATDGLFFTNGEQLGALVLRHRLPAIFAYHEFAAAGGLMSYGGNLIAQSRLLGAAEFSKANALPIFRSSRSQRSNSSSI